MNNHNTHFYSKEEVERTLNSTEEFEDGEQLFYFIGTLRFLYDENNEKDKEIERLNNIIDELEKWLKIVENITVMNEVELAYCNAYGNCLDKLKELKGE